MIDNIVATDFITNPNMSCFILFELTNQNNKVDKLLNNIITRNSHTLQVIY